MKDKIKNPLEELFICNEERLSLKRFLEINRFVLNRKNMRYENNYRYVDYKLVKYAEQNNELFQLQKELWRLNENTKD